MYSGAFLCTVFEQNLSRNRPKFTVAALLKSREHGHRPTSHETCCFHSAALL